MRRSMDSGRRAFGMCAHVNAEGRPFTEYGVQMYIRQLEVGNRAQPATFDSVRRGNSYSSPLNTQLNAPFPHRYLKLLPDGRSLVDTIGTRRFRVLENSTLDGYHTAKVRLYLQVTTVNKYWLPRTFD